jgi:SAM-dependent methyltransferase
MATNISARGTLTLPVNLASSVWSRRVSVLLTFIAALLLTATYVAGDYLNLFLAESRASPIIIAVIALVHLRYLWLVNELHLLSKPVQNIKASDAFLPILLSLAYLLFAVSALWSDKRFGVAATGFMAGVYLLWWRHDTKRHRELGDTWKRSQNVTWIRIDAVFFLILLGFFVHDIYKYPDIGSESKIAKDVLVFTCLGLFTVFRYGSQALDNEYYHRTYKSFLEKLPKGSLAWRTPGINGTISERIGKSGLQILDFGCANGKRGLELLSLLGVPKNAVSLYWGVDRNDVWRESFDAQFKAFPGEQRFLTPDELDRDNSRRTFDLVIMSHVFYGSERFTRFTRNGLASMLADGGVIAVRGYAPSSAFWSVSRDRAHDIFSSSLDVFWVSKFLRPWMKRNRLSLVGGELSTCHADIRVNYPLEAKERLCRVITFFYGDTAGGKIDQLLSDAQFRGEGAIPLDDILYFIERAQ